MINQLVGMKIERIAFVEDCIQLFANNAVISVYNPMVSCYAGHQYEVKNENDIEWTVNKEITRTTIQDDEYFRIHCCMDYLEISLKESDYCSPEAVEIWLNKGMYIVIQ